MSDEWRRSILVPIIKNKGDVQSCTNYQDQTNEPYIEVMGEDYWTLFKESYQRHRKPIWFYAREIDYGHDFLDEATCGEMYEAKERHAYGLYWLENGLWQSD
jgi:hypothetical protein